MGAGGVTVVAGAGASLADPNSPGAILGPGSSATVIALGTIFGFKYNTNALNGPATTWLAIN